MLTFKVRIDKEIVGKNETMRMTWVGFVFYVYICKKTKPNKKTIFCWLNAKFRTS